MIRFARRAAIAVAALSLLAGGLGALPAAAETGTATIEQQITCTGGAKQITAGGVSNPSPVNFGGTAQTTTASFTVQAGYTGGCTAAGWRVTLIAAGSGAITASNVATDGVTAPTLVSGQPTLPTTGASANGPLNVARTTMTAAVNTGNGLYGQSVPLKLTIPAYTAPGTYSITLTATVIAGPL